MLIRVIAEGTMKLLRLAEDAAVETGVVSLQQLIQRADLQQRSAAAAYKTMQQQTAAVIIQKDRMLSNVTKYTIAAAEAKKQAGASGGAEGELEAAEEALEAAVISGDAAALAQAEAMVAAAEAKMHAEAKGSSQAIMDDITRLNGTPDVEELLEAAEVIDGALHACIVFRLPIDFLWVVPSLQVLTDCLLTAIF